MIELRKYLLIKWLSVKNGDSLSGFILLLSLIFISFLKFNPFITILISTMINVVFYSSKKDYSFLIHFFNRGKIFTILFIEFLLLNSVLVLAILQSKTHVIFIVIHLILAISIFLYSIRVRNGSKVVFEFNLIPLKYFELKSYLRHRAYFLVFYIFCFVLIFQDYFLFFLYSMFVMEFFSQIFSNNENKEILNGYFNKKSIRYKIISNVLFILSLFYLITIILTLYLYDKYLVYTIYICLITLLFSALTISHKYQNYNGNIQNNHLGVSKTILYFVLSISIIGAIYKVYYNIKLGSKNINSYVEN